MQDRATAAGPARLTASSLALFRGERLLFRDIAIDLSAGGGLRLTGANGTGKSSLLRILAGLLRPSMGTVVERGGISFLGHASGLDPARTLRSELQSWGLDPTKAAWFETGPLLDLPIGRLSQGQQRRAALTRVTAAPGKIWLLDEPAAGLDAKSRGALGDALSAHFQEDGIAVVATHGESELPSMAELSLGAPA